MIKFSNNKKKIFFFLSKQKLKKKNLPHTFSSLSSLDPFCKVHCNLKEVHKTGLGSSAALITSLVSALFVHFEIVSSHIINNDRMLIHNVAQFCHCLAQGKVGSGFDISAAVWGSHIYKRFSPSILENVMVFLLSQLIKYLSFFKRRIFLNISFINRIKMLISRLLIILLIQLQMYKYNYYFVLFYFLIYFFPFT